MAGSSSSLRPIYRWAVGVWLVLAVGASAVALYRLGPGSSTDAESAAVSAQDIGTTSPGILLVVTPRPDATLDVTESVLLDAPTRSLAVRPPDFSAAGPTFTDQRPYASKVRITAADRPVPMLDDVVNRPLTLDLDQPARRFEMRYELNRAVVRSEPSSSGRALGAIRPMTDSVEDGLAVAVIVLGDTVRNLSCPGLELAQQACATGSPPLLRVNTDLPWRSAVVVVQLDLDG